MTSDTKQPEPTIKDIEMVLRQDIIKASTIEMRQLTVNTYCLFLQATEYDRAITDA